MTDPRNNPAAPASKSGAADHENRRDPRQKAAQHAPETGATNPVRAAAVKVLAVRPANWDDPEDPESVEAWSALEAALTSHQDEGYAWATRLSEIISDAEIARVHGNADFGAMTPRDVVSDGVRKYAVGYESGYTQLQILLEHRLITKPRPGSYRADLTKKGKKYARVLYQIDKSLAPERRLPLPEVERLRAAIRHARFQINDGQHNAAFFNLGLALAANECPTPSRAELVSLVMQETTDEIIADGWMDLGKPNVLTQGCRYIRRNAPPGPEGYADPEEAALKFAGFIADRILATLIYPANEEKRP